MTFALALVSAVACGASLAALAVFFALPEQHTESGGGAD